MSSDAVRAIVEARVSALVNGAYKIAWDNVVFKPAVGTAFIRCSIDNVYSHQIAMRCIREFFTIDIQVLTPYGAGTKANMAIGDALVIGFTGYASGLLLCKTGRLARVGQIQEWHQRAVVIDAQYDNHF